ncbi:MAG TPA: 5'-3' exonuclease H3TH domain-containing protein, partial [Methylotenera sp.]|nr:5'-3' exonuclease H3TH domain-containing protein [Methylotenera sp.]
MTTENKIGKKLVLVDGSSYLFRAYHALPPLTNSKGVPTGAIYGVVNMLRRLLLDEKPDYIAVIFDTKGKNFRHELYQEYKANRTVMPDDLAVQIAPLHDIIRALGLPLIAIEGYEADDVIGTLATLATKLGIETVISTSDKDMAQLVDTHVTLVNTMTSSVLDEKNVFTKFGVTPRQIIDYLTLVGDPVDNVPGVPKVGPKTAAKWLQEYKTLDNLIENAAAITGKVGEYFREAIPQLALSKQLVTIAHNVPIEIEIVALIQKAKAEAELKALYQDLEFKSWLKELEKNAQGGQVESQEISEPSNKAKGSYESITQEKALMEWVSLLNKAKSFSFAALVKGANLLEAELVGLSFAIDENKAAYVPLAHAMSEEEQLPRDWVLLQLMPILENKDIAKIGIDIKKDLHILARYGIFIQNFSQDAMLESYVLNSIATKHEIEALAKKYLQYQTLSYDEVAGKGAKQVAFDQVSIKVATEYAAEMVDVTLALHRALYPQLVQTPKLLNV